MKKLTKSINSQFTPTYMVGVPMYGLGSFLQDDMGGKSTGAAIGGGALKGAQAGMALGPWGALAGAVIGGTAGLIGNEKEDEALKKQMLVDKMNKYNAALQSFADGGSIHIKPSKRGTFTAAATKHGKSVQAFASQVLANKDNYSPAMVKKANFARNAANWHEAGGFLDSIFTPYMCGGKMKANGGPLDNITVYQNGGTHEANPVGGVPIGNKGMVEEGEVRWKDYIFSNRF